MRKILLSFDGTHYSKGAFDFARRMNDEEPILLTGAFLPQVDFANSWSYANGGGSVYIPLIEGYDADVVAANIAKFEEDCVRHNIEHRVHRDFSSFALPELQKESRYADLMILGSQRFYENLGLESPNEYLRDALHDAECPVLITPEEFDYPESIVLAFDGSRSSVYAIKQFAYLFPELCRNRSIVVYATKKEGGNIPDEDYIKELAARHFSNLTFYELEANPRDSFSTWITDQDRPILVSGAFGRSGFSQIFKRSFASDVIAENRFPVFIAHR
ncbi:universal stress protein [Chitinophaga sp. CF418]|uniref:universal stress protein n=1 Tax=Chitinophaga sp. CF418 TaxID=1855287 RepID=UPI000917D550|nr:universal stress protein [Chitinophaga sp. CF418]SHN28609.1 Nucleotide-binding universal stress protein, UspA family [Chitinophaga sp. CF418]